MSCLPHMLPEPSIIEDVAGNVDETLLSTVVAGRPGMEVSPEDGQARPAHIQEHQQPSFESWLCDFPSSSLDDLS